MSTSEARIDDACRFLRGHGFTDRYACAIVTGTGLGGLLERVEESVSLPYTDIPGFPNASVSGHGGRLHRGRLADVPVLVLEGRVHAYETGDAGAMRVPIGTVAGLGVDVLLLTSASGSLDPRLPPGTIAALADHINLSGLNPLVNEASDARFVSMVGAYDPALRTQLQSAARTCGLSLPERVYAWFGGPSFETPAEIRAAGRLGADLAGMSTVPEVIVARFYGLRVAALSVVTNYAAGVAGGNPNHLETKDVAERAAADLGRLVTAFVARLSVCGGSTGE